MANEFDPYHKWLGIPPKHQPPDHYRLLGIERFEADADVISLAADQRMQYLRTFQNGERAKISQELLNEVATARSHLLDKAKKATYDQYLQQKAESDKEASSHIGAISGEDRAAVLKFEAPDVEPEIIERTDDPRQAGSLWSPTTDAGSGRQRQSSRSRVQNPQHRIIILAVLLILLLALSIFLMRGRPDSGAEPVARGESNQETNERDPKAKEEVERKLKEEPEQIAKENAKRKATRKAEQKARYKAERRAKEQADRKAKEVAERKAKEQADRKTKEETERKVKEESRRNAKEEAKRIAKAETERLAKADAARRAKQQAERKVYEEEFIRDWFEQNFEQTNIGWAPRIRDDLQQSMKNLKKSKNMLAKSLQESQSLLHSRKNLRKMLQTAEKAKNDFKPKKEAASSRIRRVKKIEEALTSAQNKMTANSDRLKGKKTEIVAQVRAFQSDIQICRTQNAKITALRHHRYTDRFVEANGLKIASPLSPSTFKVETKKAEKVLKKTIEVQRNLDRIE